MEAPPLVAIVGCGISGLSAAHFLARHAPAIRLHLFEQANRFGGKILTEQVDGYVVEGGPDSFLASKPRGLGLASELGLEPRLQGTDQSTRRTWVMFEGQLHRLPEGLSGLVPSRLEPLLESALFTPSGKERLARETEIPAREGNEDESLASFIGRRFGTEVYERMIEPLMAGIYGGDGERLSLDATFPQLRHMEREFGSILMAMKARDTANAPEATRSAFLTPIGGVGELVDALVQQLGRARISSGVGVCSISHSASGYRLQLSTGTSIQADAVIVATPAGSASHILRDLDARTAEALHAIPHASSAIVSLAYSTAQVPRALEGYGYIVPRREGRAVLASTWSSTKFHHRAPAGRVLLRVFLGRAGAEEVLAGSDDELVDLARAEVHAVLGCGEAPSLERVTRWKDGMPQYTLGHLDRIAEIESGVRQNPGLFIAGNFLRGVGIPDCIESGEGAARAAVTYLRTHMGTAGID